MYDSTAQRLAELKRQLQLQQQDPLAQAKEQAEMLYNAFGAIQPPPDKTVLGGASMGFKYQGADMISYLADLAQADTGYGGDVANYFDGVAKNNQRQVEYGELPNKVTNLDYYTNGQGLAYDAGQIASMAAVSPLLPIAVALKLIQINKQGGI